MRLLAAAIVAGFLILAGSIMHNANEADGPDASDTDAVAVVRAYANALSAPVEEVRHISGPFVLVTKGESCYLVDISTKYTNVDRFWTAGPEKGKKSVSC